VTNISATNTQRKHGVLGIFDQHHRRGRAGRQVCYASSIGVTFYPHTSALLSSSGPIPVPTCTSKHWWAPVGRCCWHHSWMLATQWAGQVRGQVIRLALIALVSVFRRDGWLTTVFLISRPSVFPGVCPIVPGALDACQPCMHTPTHLHTVNSIKWLVVWWWAKSKYARAKQIQWVGSTLQVARRFKCIFYASQWLLHACMHVHTPTHNHMLTREHMLSPSLLHHLRSCGLNNKHVVYMLRVMNGDKQWIAEKRYSGEFYPHALAHNRIGYT